MENQKKVPACFFHTKDFSFWFRNFYENKTGTLQLSSNSFLCYRIISWRFSITEIYSSKNPIIRSSLVFCFFKLSEHIITLRSWFHIFKTMNVFVDMQICGRKRSCETKSVNVSKFLQKNFLSPNVYMDIGFLCYQRCCCASFY